MNITDQIQPTISAIIPARNEQATIDQCVESLAQQPEITEILVINDQSTDATGEIVQTLQATYPQLRLLQTVALPPGWVGKNHAVFQGAREAKGDWLLFTDADVIHGPASARRALQIAGVLSATRSTAIPGCVTATSASDTGSSACALASSSAISHLVSFSPEQLTESWYEKALIPVVYCRLANKFSFDYVNDPANPAAAANGQFLLISREAYDAVGGHAAIAAELLEDVALATKVKQAGYRIWFGSGKGIVSVRMYRTFAAMWEGWKKNLYRLMGADPAALVSEISTATVPIIVPTLFVAAIWAFTKDWRSGLFAAIVGLAAWHSRYRRELRNNQYSASLVWFGIPGKLLYAAVLWASYRAHQKGHLAWKGREYPVGTPQASNEGAKR